MNKPRRLCTVCHAETEHLVFKGVVRKNGNKRDIPVEITQCGRCSHTEMEIVKVPKSIKK